MKVEKAELTKTKILQISNNIDNLPYYLATDVRRQFKTAINIVLKHDQDRVYPVTGTEGSGKSKLARQLAYAIDPTFSLDRIVFTPDDFMAAIKKAKPGQAIIWDECFSGLSSRSSLSKQNKQIVQLLQECRFLNLFIFLVLPSFFLLEKYVALFRTKALFHTAISKSNPNIRYYRIYNYADKKKLYLLGKQLMDYSRPRITNAYRFYNKEIPTIDYDEYVKKKNDNFRNTDTNTDEESKNIKLRNFLLYLLHNECQMSYVNIGKRTKEAGLGLDPSGIGKIVRTYAKNTEKEKGIYNILSVGNQINDDI